MTLNSLILQPHYKKSNKNINDILFKMTYCINLTFFHAFFDFKGFAQQ